MHEVPEHMMIPINEAGEGPVDLDHLWGYRCWCGTDCGTVEHVTSLDGNRMCEDMAREGMEAPQVPGLPRPGTCTACYAYTIGLFRLLRDAEGDEQ